MAAGKAPKPKGGAKAPKPIKASATKKGRPKTAQFSTLTWDKHAGSTPWSSGQSMGIHPGSPAAISKYRHSKKFVARSKKVIRPRINKVRTAFTAPKAPK